MLEFFCDAHTHFASDAEGYALCCAVNKEEWTAQTADCRKANVFRSFGVHPLFPDMAGVSFLETLLQQGALCAVGEAGYDFRAKGNRDDVISLQEEVFYAQLDLALRYKKPVIVHCVKAIDKIFRDAKRLSVLDALIFHAFGGSGTDAASILRRGVNAYFSFGKGLLKSKRAIDCASKIPLDRLLLETDNDSLMQKGASKPYSPISIKDVYNAACIIRSMGMDDMCRTVKSNFFKLLPHYSQ